MMRKTKIFILSCLMSILTLTANAQQTNESYDWSKVIDAIIKVESRGNPKAFNPNGNCVGILQITKICVKEANNILEEKKIKKKFSLSDRLDVKKSKEIFILIQEKYNPEKDVVKACRVWNEGPYYNRNIKTTKYVEKVLENLK